MSSAVYVALEKEIPGVDASSVSGKWLARACESLETLAAAKGCKPLADFVSADPAALADPALEELQIPEEQWLDPAEELTAVAAILSLVQGGSPAFRKVTSRT